MEIRVKGGEVYGEDRDDGRCFETLEFSFLTPGKPIWVSNRSTR